MNHYNVIVVGTGSMGMSTVAYLGMQGVKVLAIDPFKGPHDQGSHTGKTRIIRQSYYEHPSYVPLLLRSYELWNELELMTNAHSEIYHNTGLVYMGPKESKVIQGIKVSAKQYNLNLKPIQQDHFCIANEWETWLEEKAGYLDIQAAFNSYFTLFNTKFIEYKNEKLISWKQLNQNVQIKTEVNSYTADKIIFTSGACTSEIVKKHNLPLQVTKQMLAWLEVEQVEKYKEGNFPCWFINDPEKGMYYGFPIAKKNENGLKLALHMPGDIIDPTDKERPITNKDIRDIEYCLDRYLPNIQVKKIRYESCMYTYSPDENFIIDFIPNSDQKVIIACGFSGHGFKFVPVVGQILTSMCLGKPIDLDIDFLKLNRFSI